MSNGDDVRSLPFIKNTEKEGRFDKLNHILNKIKWESVSSNNNFTVQIKTFYPANTFRWKRNFYKL